MVSKHLNKSSAWDSVFHPPCCVCLFMASGPDLMGRMFADGLCSVWSDKQVLLGPEGGPTLTLPRVCFSCVDLRIPWAVWSLCPPRWLICSVHRCPQPVLASANWQLEFDFAHRPPLHPWKCVVCQIRFTECAQHPGVEDRGLWATDVWVGSLLTDCDCSYEFYLWQQCQLATHHVLFGRP